MTLQRCWWDLNPVRLTVLAAKSVDYNTAQQHPQYFNTHMIVDIFQYLLMRQNE